MGLRRWYVAILGAAAGIASVAAAQPVTVNGVTFSDEFGGFTIAGASGTGTIDDPFVVIEDVTGPSAAVLVIRGLGPEFGNRVGTLHPTGFALRKVMRNHTPFVWTYIDFELQQLLGVASDYLDGLSFGQGAVSGRPFQSNRFDEASELHEPLDTVTFHGGQLKPGESATFDVIVTDTTPIDNFYLVQRPNRPLALDAPVPQHYREARHW